MELLTPGIGLILWQLLFLVTVPLTIASVILIITGKFLPPDRKILWLAAVLFIPLFGSVLFLVSLKKMKAESAKQEVGSRK